MAEGAWRRKITTPALRSAVCCVASERELLQRYISLPLAFSFVLSLFLSPSLNCAQANKVARAVGICRCGLGPAAVTDSSRYCQRERVDGGAAYLHLDSVYRYILQRARFFAHIFFASCARERYCSPASFELHSERGWWRIWEGGSGVGFPYGEGDGFVRWKNSTSVFDVIYLRWMRI